MTKAQLAVRDRAREYLRTRFPKGSTVSTVFKHVSRSGMYRVVSVMACDDDGGIHDVSLSVARAIGFKYDTKHGGVGVSGCGMDSGFEVVYSLSVALYCPGKYDHDAAYALKRRWA